jgi:hypothetical protein
MWLLFAAPAWGYINVGICANPAAAEMSGTSGRWGSRFLGVQSIINTYLVTSIIYR